MDRAGAAFERAARTVAATSLAVVVAGGALVGAAPPAFAGQPGSGSVVLNQADPIHYGTGTANLTFTVSQSATAQPWVTVTCSGKQSYSQKSVLLYGQTLGYFQSWPYGQTFTIGIGSSNLWLDPTDAKCGAELWYADSAGQAVDLAYSSFTAAP